MGNNLKKAVSTYYNDFSLSEDQLNQLRSQLESSEDHLKENHFIKSNWVLPAACGFAIAIAISLSLYVNSLKPLNDRISAEVAYNHKKAMPSEVITASYTVLNQALDKLDFIAKQSSLLPGNFQLIGGRYCSVLGKTAAQLKLKNKATNEEYTLYQFSAKGLEGLSDSPATLKNDGVRIKVWREGDLGFALAK